MIAWRIVCSLAVGLSGGMALSETGQRSKNPSPLLIAAEGTSQQGSQSVGDRIAQWLKTCLEDWDAATHMTRNEWGRRASAYLRSAGNSCVKIRAQSPP